MSFDSDTYLSFSLLAHLARSGGLPLLCRCGVSVPENSIRTLVGISVAGQRCSRWAMARKIDPCFRSRILGYRGTGGGSGSGRAASDTLRWKPTSIYVGRSSRTPVALEPGRRRAVPLQRSLWSRRRAALLRLLAVKRNDFTPLKIGICAWRQCANSLQ